MNAERRFWVTPRDGMPYRVVLRPAPGGWEAEVERDGKRWTFPLTEGARGEAWSGDRALRFRWDPEGGRLALDGWWHELAVESDAAHRASALRRSEGTSRRATEVRAPMPGLVLVVEVAEGDRVTERQGLLIVEAMKMENEIRAPAAGVVRGLSVAAGATVERDELLCRVDPEP